MRFIEPKNSRLIQWTEHVKVKMRFYYLSESRLRKILRNPDRTEMGVAPNTVAIMQKTMSKKQPTEIWMMYQFLKKKTGNLKNKDKIIVISAWRYPGQSPKGFPPIPEDVIQEFGLM